MTTLRLPEDTLELEYSHYDAYIRTTNRYPCGCEYSIIWEDITKGKILEVDIPALTWCEEHDPTVPHYDEDSDFETQWEEEWTEEDYEQYANHQYDGVFDDE